jgi:8-oxo-dGTP diphosphatase
VTAASEILIAVAVILNSRNEMLVVRKRGTQHFMQPGGKIDAGETPLDALQRELREEINLDVAALDAEFLGIFHEEAAHEPDTTVKAHAFAVKASTDIRAAAEIEEIHWLPLADISVLPLARLTEFEIVPQARKISKQKAETAQ